MTTFLLSFISFFLFVIDHVEAQRSPQALLDTFFSAIQHKNETLFLSCFIPEALVHTVDSKGVVSNSVTSFTSTFPKLKSVSLEEIIFNVDIDADERIGQAWMDYIFYVDGALSHSGHNAFQLIKNDSVWKIQAIVDSRYTGTLGIDTIQQESKENQIHVLLDNWHQAAAEAKFAPYFDAMSSASIFIGTDPTERWTKEEFMKYSRPYFEKGKTWSFTPKERHIQFIPCGEKNNCAIVDELLDTWMGVCRSTAIVEKIEEQWMIIYYHLSIAVPNDVINEYLKLLD